jgi:hypothetical protein
VKQAGHMAEIDPTAAARAGYAAALRSTLATMRLLQGDLAEVRETVRGLPMSNLSALANVGALELTLGKVQWAFERQLAPPDRTAELRAAADADLAAALERLERAKAIEPLTSSMSDDRRRIIEGAALAVVQTKRRRAALDPDPDNGALAGWLRGFVRDVKQFLATAPALPRGGGETLATIEAQEAAAARREDPLGALLAEAMKS